MSKKALNIQEDSRCKGIQGNTSKAEIKCVCLNARSIINKKNELNIMVDDIKPHIIGITESWAHKDITDAELGLEGYVMFRKDRIGKKGGGVLLYIKDIIPAYEVGETGYGCHTFYITDVFRNIVIIADVRLLLRLHIVSCAHINMQFVIFTS